MDERLIVHSLGSDNTIRTWDPATGQQTNAITYSGSTTPPPSSTASPSSSPPTPTRSSTAGTRLPAPNSRHPLPPLGPSPSHHHRLRRAPPGDQWHLSRRPARPRPEHQPEHRPHPTGYYHGKPIRKNALTTTHYGNIIAITTSTRPNEPVKTWNATTGPPTGELPVHDAENLAAALIDGRPIAVTSVRDTVKGWDLTTDKQIGPDQQFSEPVTAVAIAPAGHLVICASRKIIVMTASTMP
ncbi:hypothetical protein GCM10009734_50780 [Nonomuraea bangladeshensis]